MMKSIDGTELKKHIESTICYGCEIGHVVTPCGRCNVTDLLKYIDEIPEVDAQPIKHGKWEEYSRNALETYIECTNCHVASRPIHLQMVTKDGSGLPDFCPNCGAKMCGGVK